jgi:hypothetical protein
MGAVFPLKPGKIFCKSVPILPPKTLELLAEKLPETA